MRNVNIKSLILAALCIYRHADSTIDYSDRLEFQSMSICRTVDICNNAKHPAAKVSLQGVKCIIEYYHRLFHMSNLPTNIQPSNVYLLGSLLIIEGWYVT